MASESVLMTGAMVAVIGGLVWRCEPLVKRWLATREAAVELAVSVQSAPAKPDVLPPDLESYVDAESMPWAREQTRAALQDAYQAHGDWDHIRSQIFR